MLWKASAISGFAIEASDGPLGTVSDFLFDDTSWMVRWLVVDTSKWLSGRLILLPPSVLGDLDQEHKELLVSVNKQQIKDSPDITTDRPVSRQMESNVYDHYGWKPYWPTGLYMGGPGYLGGYVGGNMSTSPISESRRQQERIDDAQREHDDPHLRSIAAVTGYHIHAVDGEIGHVQDLFIEDADWSIHYLVVDTKNWWPGKRVLIAPGSAKTIDWTHKLVNLNVDRQTIKDSPAYDSSTTIDQLYERHFHSYYGGTRSQL
jgi:hypothetical protein